MQSFEYYGTVEEIARTWGTARWVPEAIDGLLDDLPEWIPPHSEAPEAIRSGDLSAKLTWLTTDCQPPLTIPEIEDYLIECQSP